MSKQIDYSKTSKNELQCRRTSQFIVNLDVTVSAGVSSSINGSDEMHRCKSLRLSRGHWIRDGPPRFQHVAHFRSNERNVIRLILI